MAIFPTEESKELVLVNRLCRCGVVRAASAPALNICDTRCRDRASSKYIAARGRPIIVEWERDARHSAGLSLVRFIEGVMPDNDLATGHKLADINRQPSTVDLEIEYHDRLRLALMQVAESRILHALGRGRPPNEVTAARVLSPAGDWNNRDNIRMVNHTSALINT
ncbi:hypothetical protein EVAR_19853_1 [Eumeta japonica]|uniref:Uncharacterized protein n=1 Tax=Eumeta variegata TaxID=151549 RepID=A0A4C1UQT7_EUMVA|nr:hypothetical protein EVAR_19853_1 [Eumeta japonica]